MKSALAVFFKDVSGELRARYAINSLAMFVVVAVSAVLFSVGEERISPAAAGGLFWLVAFFAAMTGLSRAFVSEEERGTATTLRLLTIPSAVFNGKTLFNLALAFALDAFVWTLFAALFDDFVVVNLPLFVVVFTLGTIGVAVSSTIVAAIVARARAKGALYPALGFPILLPLLLVAVEITSAAALGGSIADSLVDVALLVCYDVVLYVVSLLLFDFVWVE
jgi:heme exporter protein B